MKRRVLPVIISFLILALVFGSIGFVVAYYKYSGQIARERTEMQKEQELLQALIKAQEESPYNINKDNNDRITVSNYNDIINHETQLIYETLYTQCGDIIEELRSPTSELIGLNKDGLEEYLIGNQLDWEIECFSKEKVVLSKQADEICPNHYLVSVKNGCIAIYKYYENGEKRLIQQTDIPINILPVIDQEKLQKGILVNTEKEVNQLLEDYSS